MSGYLVFDTETTGLPQWGLPAEAEGQPRLASWCMIFADQNLDIEFEWSALVRPDGWEMPAEAMAVNGLTNERLREEGQSVRWPLSLLALATQQGRALAAHNLQFDSKVMRGECRRLIAAGGPLSDGNVRWGTVPGAALAATIERCRYGICTMRGLTQACGIPHPKLAGQYKYPRLSEACAIILDEALEGAHNCVADAHACLRLLRAMRQRNLLPLAA